MFWSYLGGKKHTYVNGSLKVKQMLYVY